MPEDRDTGGGAEGRDRVSSIGFLSFLYLYNLAAKKAHILPLCPLHRSAFHTFHPIIKYFFFSAYNEVRILG